MIIKNFDEYINDINQIDFLSWYFSGMFIARGSISKLESTSYHLEIQFDNLNQAEQVEKFLNDKNFNFKIIKHKNKFILYLKKSEEISDFLKTIQTFKSLLIFESKRTERDHLIFSQRYVNLESYNLEKISKGFLEFEKRYNFIKEHDLLFLFSEDEQTFFKIKLKNSFDSLNDLVLIYNKKTKKNITKSGLNHYLMKLKKIYLKNLKRKEK